MEQGTLAEEELLDHPSSEPYSFCHLQPPRINASAPILWTHLHQNPCFHIHTQVHVAGPTAVMVDEHVFLLMLIRSGRKCLELDVD